jgi:hypothetical protein
MARIVFKSLQDPNNRRYLVSTERVSDRSDNQVLSDRVGWFETYGDGDTQHCHTMPVGVALFSDFCASAAEYLSGVAVADAEDLLGILSSEMRHYAVCPDRMRAMMKVRFKEGKRCYMETSTGKVSSAESKRYDTRWQEVVQWMDGGFDAVAGLLGVGRGCFLYVASVYTDFARMWQNLTGEPAADLSKFFPWLGWGWEEDNQARDAFNALRGFVKAYDAREGAMRSLACWNSNEALRRERAAESAA